MDGNGRWAARRGLSVAEGHRAGSRALRPVVETAIDLGVESLAVYAFSTENWTRSPHEVAALMEIFGETIDRELLDLAKEGVHTRFVGRRDRAPAWLQEKMRGLEAATEEPDPHALPGEIGELAVDRLAEDLHQGVDLAGRPGPVLRRESVHDHRADSELDRRLDRPSERARPLAMALRNRHPVHSRPARVAVEDDRHAADRLERRLRHARLSESVEQAHGRPHTSRISSSFRLRRSSILCV